MPFINQCHEKKFKPFVKRIAHFNSFIAQIQNPVLMTCKIAPNSFFISNRLGPTEDILRTGKPLRERQEEKRRKVPVLVPILNLLKQEVNYARHAKSQRDIQSHICRHEISWGLTESMTASGRATFALVRPSLFVAFSAICFFRHRSIAFDILL